MFCKNAAISLTSAYCQFIRFVLKIRAIRCTGRVVRAAARCAGSFKCEMTTISLRATVRYSELCDSASVQAIQTCKERISTLKKGEEGCLTFCTGASLILTLPAIPLLQLAR